MSKRNEPVHKTAKEILADLLTGHREAAFNGPVMAQKYLARTLEGQQSLPNAVKAVAFDLLAEARAQLQDWEGVLDAVGRDSSNTFPTWRKAWGTDSGRPWKPPPPWSEARRLAVSGGNSTRLLSSATSPSG